MKNAQKNSTPKKEDGSSVLPHDSATHSAGGFPLSPTSNSAKNEWYTSSMLHLMCMTKMSKSQMLVSTSVAVAPADWTDSFDT